MELRQLRHFVAVAEHRSFSEAAAKVYLSQPALTRSIQQLEKFVGMPLLIRGARSVSLTPAGERFYQYAAMIVGECTLAKSAVADIKSGAVGSVTIGVGSIFAPTIIATALLRCRTQLPAVEIRTVSGTLEELTTFVRRSSIDFAFTTFVDLEKVAGVVLEPLMTLHDVVLAGREHPLVKERHPDPQTLASSRWAVINRPHALEAHASFFVSLGLHVPRAVRTNSLALIRGLVAEQGFLAMLPREAVATDIRAGSIRVLRTTSSAGRRRAGLLLPERRAEPAVARVMQIVRETCTGRGASGPDADIS
jgi:DNA-binding transcriptional LysR family regulator